jgi:kanosamine 6-kinase
VRTVGSAEEPVYLGIDLGGTKVAAALATATDATAGRLTRHVRARWPAPPASTGPDRAVRDEAVRRDLAVLRGLVGGLRSATPRGFAGVGVAVAATLGAGGRVTAWPTRPSWTGLDLLDEVRALAGCEPAWGDDGALAALAEAAAAGVTDLVYVGVGTGVGGGIVAGGRPLPDPARGSCELGHLVVQRGGERCDCGRRGCVQAESSGPAVLRRAAAERGRPVSFDDLRAGWQGRERWAVAAVGCGCAGLAAALAGVGELARPAVHVVGGGFAVALPGFVAEVARQATALSRPGHPVAPVRPARFGGRSSLHGALVVAARPAEERVAREMTAEGVSTTEA